MAFSCVTSVSNAMLDVITAAAGNAALIRIYDNTGGVPANADAALGAQVLLAELVCGTPFAAAAALKVLTGNAITTDASANASGTAAFFRLCTSGGAVVAQGLCAVGGGELSLLNTAITAGVPVSITSLVWTAP